MSAIPSLICGALAALALAMAGLFLLPSPPAPVAAEPMAAPATRA